MAEPRSRRSLLAGVATLAATTATAGCVFDTPHDDEVKLTNDRGAAVTVTVTARNLRSDAVTLTETVSVPAGGSAYVRDPAKGIDGVPHRFTVETAAGTTVTRDWSPANPGQQLKVRLRPGEVTFEVGAVS